MKATITILAAFLTLQAGILFAGNDNIVPASNDNFTISLAPATPVEANFEDITTISLVDLMPVTLYEATFDDMPAVMPALIDLSPSTPEIADFEDVDVSIDNAILIPVGPVVADFE